MISVKVFTLQIKHITLEHTLRNPLLRRLINDHVGYWAEIYELPNYVPVKRSEITDIEFYIKDEAGNYASLLTNPVSITLHFRSFPFYHER